MRAGRFRTPLNGRLESFPHNAIARWRLEERQRRTQERRPDLYARWQVQDAAEWKT